MKNSATCPKCASTKLLVIDEVQHIHEQGDGIAVAHDIAVVPMSVTAGAVCVREADQGIFRLPAVMKLGGVGRFEAWICAACGYTEWYAKRLEELASLAVGGAVRVIERDSTGAYR